MADMLHRAVIRALTPLRKTYGEDFLSDFRGDAHLGTVLEETGADSLSELVKKHRKNK
jgi:hypothetical protein